MSTDGERPPDRVLVTASEVARQVVAMAVWAPSLHNTQPWWFSADGPKICLYADTSRQLPVADPYGRQLLVSCGAALFTARLALRSLGYVPETQVLPDLADPALVAQISWQRRAAATEYEWLLAGQVRRRRTHRGGFEPVPVPQNLLATLRSGAEGDGASLRVVRDEGRRAALASIAETAEQVVRLDSSRMRELSQWTFPPGSPRRDGVPFTSYPARAEPTDPSFPGRDFAHGRGWGLPPLSVPAHQSAGAACVLTTVGDGPADWLNAGQALQRILLTAGLHGIAAALHSQPIEVAWLREQVRADFCDGAFPQLVLRLGAVVQTEQSVRRLPADVLHGREERLPGGEPVWASAPLAKDHARG
jgi:hypothetical protein